LLWGLFTRLGFIVGRIRAVHDAVRRGRRKQARACNLGNIESFVTDGACNLLDDCAQHCAEQALSGSIVVLGAGSRCRTVPQLFSGFRVNQFGFRRNPGIALDELVAGAVLVDFYIEYGIRAENPIEFFKAAWIRISSATLGYQWLEQI